MEENESLEYWLRNCPAEVECPKCGAMAGQIGQSSTGNATGWMAITVYLCKYCYNVAFSTVGVSCDGD